MIFKKKDEAKVIEVGSKATSAPMKVVSAIAGAAGAMGRVMPRGIRRPDDLIQRRDLYGINDNAMSPVGRKVNGMDLYTRSKRPIGGGRRIPLFPTRRPRA